MKVEIYDGQNKVSDLSLSKIFDDAEEKVLHQVVVARLANNRQGNASTKTRSEAHGGGKKPWKQKGLGRARAGTRRSPLWTGGGVTFGPKPRNFRQIINKKQKAKAYLYVFKKLNELGALKALSSIKIKTLKTKDFIAFLKTHESDLQKRIVLVTAEYDKNLLIASRNIPNIQVFSVNNIDILPLVFADKVLVTEDALKALDLKFSKILQ